MYGEILKTSERLNIPSQGCTCFPGAGGPSKVTTIARVTVVDLVP